MLLRIVLLSFYFSPYALSAFANNTKLITLIQDAQKKKHFYFQGQIPITSKPKFDYFSNQAPEIMSHITSFLSAQEVMALGSCNKKTNDIVKSNNSFWKNVYFQSCYAKDNSIVEKDVLSWFAVCKLYAFYINKNAMIINGLSCKNTMKKLEPLDDLRERYLGLCLKHKLYFTEPLLTDAFSEESSTIHYLRSISSSEGACKHPIAFMYLRKAAEKNHPIARRKWTLMRYLD